MRTFHGTEGLLLSPEANEIIVYGSGYVGLGPVTRVAATFAAVDDGAARVLLRLRRVLLFETVMGAFMAKIPPVLEIEIGLPPGATGQLRAQEVRYDLMSAPPLLGPLPKAHARFYQGAIDIDVESWNDGEPGYAKSGVCLYGGKMRWRDATYLDHMVMTFDIFSMKGADEKIQRFIDTHGDAT